MRWVRFSLSGRTAFGILEGERVVEVAGDPFSDWDKTGQVHRFADVKVEVPVIPKTFYAVGLNYPQHVREVAAKRGVEPDLPSQPDVGYRANTGLIAHGAPIVIPADATEAVQYEGEIVAVIGKTAKGLSEDEALGCLLGYTIGNDVSERTWQKGDRTLWRAKNTDTFKPMGPWIETDVDLDSLKTTVRVDGKVTIEFPTDNMLYGIQRYIAAMTKYVTLYPGDMIWMGTEGSSPDIKDGETVEIEISQIGTLRNRFVREK